MSNPAPNQDYTNSVFLMLKFAERTTPLPEHEALAYIQLCRWVEQRCKLDNIRMEQEIREIEGWDDEVPTKEEQ